MKAHLVHGVEQLGGDFAANAASSCPNTVIRRAISLNLCFTKFTPNNVTYHRSRIAVLGYRIQHLSQQATVCQPPTMVRCIAPLHT